MDFRSSRAFFYGILCFLLIFIGTWGYGQSTNFDLNCFAVDNAKLQIRVGLDKAKTEHDERSVQKLTEQLEQLNQKNRRCVR